MVGLTTGCLVSWIDGVEERVGVVTALTGPQVTVQFDGFEEVRVFKRSADIVRRVDLGGSIRRVSTGEIGTIQTQESADPPRWQVSFGDTVTTVQERDLRPHVLLDPASRLRTGTLGQPAQLWLALTAHRYRLDALNRDLIALSESRVTLKPHQVAVVHRVVTSYPHRFLLCDEVGLGKTIEAGVILKELRARKSADRVLIIVPPNLMRQWQFELKTKFNEVFPILNSETVRYLRTQHGADINPFEVVDSAIVSSAWITGAEWQRLATEVEWDLVIVDEAHHARIQYRGNKIERTQLYRVVEKLASPDEFSKRAVLFLTATPMQLDVGEIYGLVELLDPALFPTLQHFRAHKDRVPRLNKLVQDLKIHGLEGLPDREAALEAAARLLDEDVEDLTRELLTGPLGVDAVCERLSDRHLLSQILIRNRKKVVGGFMPRQAHRWEVTLTIEEREALDAVEDYVRNGYQQAARQNNAAVGFVMVIFQKLMASSIQALKVSLARRIDRLLGHAAATGSRGLTTHLESLRQADEAGETEMDDVLTVLGEATRAEMAELDHLVELLDSVPTDSKAATLVAKLRELEAETPNPKVLLFTEFRQTQEYLRSLLEAELGWDVQVFHGQLKPIAKDEAVEAFRDATGPSILLSTEAGGEGRNFQFCHLLVNYDLPWNPMRVEQRIGRVDRLGQTHPVHVFNFWINDTIEGRVLNVLENRIGIFEDTVGGLDPILGDTETDLRKIFQLGEAERDEALAKYEADVERRVSEARDAEERLRDFIMETRSFSRELVEQVETDSRGVSPHHFEPFAIALLSDVNTWLGEELDGSFRLHFHEPFISDFPRHTEQGVKRVVTFRPDVAADSEHVEYMTLGHPVIDDLVGRVTTQRYPGCAGGVVIPADEELVAASGWLVAHQLSVPGLQPLRELQVVFVHDSGEVDPDLASRLVARAGGIPADAAIEGVEVSAAAQSSLDASVVSTASVAWERLGFLERDVAEIAAARLTQELAKINTYFDYREQAASDKLAASLATLTRLQASEDSEQRKIIPLWSNNVRRDQTLCERLGQDRLERLAALQRQTSAAGDVTLLSVARIEIRSNAEGE